MGAARIVSFASRFDWYFDGDVPSRMFDGVKLCEPSARVFDAVAGRVGATIAGRGTYEDPDRFGDDGTPHPTAPLFVVSHRPVPQVAGRPHFHSLPEHVQLRLLEAVPAVHQS